jgi:hypothetical protein
MLTAFFLDDALLLVMYMPPEKRESSFGCAFFPPLVWLPSSRYFIRRAAEDSLLSRRAGDGQLIEYLSVEGAFGPQEIIRPIIFCNLGPPKVT